MKTELRATGNQTVEFEFEPKGISVQIIVYDIVNGKHKKILRTVAQKELKALLKSL